VQKNIFQRLSDFLKNRGLLLDGKFSVFIICILVAGLFWLLIVLSNNYTSVISFRVNYVNLPKDKVIANKLPLVIDASVTTSGFLLYTYKFMEKTDTLTINGNYLTAQSENQFYIATNSIIPEFKEQLNNKVSINFFTTDTIHFYFDKKSFKVLPVKVNLKYSFEKQYQLSGSILVSPDRIVVSGPSGVLEKLTHLETVKRSIKDLNKTEQVNLPLKIEKEFEDLSFSAKMIVVSIPVEKYTEGNIEVPVSVSNVPPHYTIKTFPDKIKIKYTVALSNFEKVRPEMFLALAEYNTQDSSKSNKLKIRLAKTPEYVLNWQIDPQKVEYILERK
jgi:YbbR domain-containing protein